MSKKWYAFIGGAMVLMVMAGCASTEIDDNPGSPGSARLRNEYTVSSDELRIAAQAAVEEAMVDQDFIEYVDAYKQKNDGKRPILKLEQARNDTTDTNLNTTELTGFIENALRKARKVNITRYEGSAKMKSIGASRKLEDDDNVDQSTVAETGTIQAASLVMKPVITENKVSQGRKKQLTRTFTLEIVDIRNGIVIWKTDKPMGFVKDKGVFSL